jgi:OOP family OmpA-OmpF porin
MKKLFMIICILLIAVYSRAQVKNILNKTKDKVLTNSGDKSGKKGETEKEESESGNNNSSGKEENQNQASSAASQMDTVAPQPAAFKAYSKYDFVPGEKVIAFEDFSTGSIGDFPAGWNTNGAGEIVTIEGKPGRWLSITRPGVFLPEFTKKYPDDFTFEFDLLHGVPFGGGQISFAIAELENFESLQAWNTSPNTFKVSFYTAASGEKEGTTTTEIRKNSESAGGNSFNSQLLSDQYNPIHISVWRQKERIRIYCNQEKLWDIPIAI